MIVYDLRDHLAGIVRARRAHELRKLSDIGSLGLVRLVGCESSPIAASHEAPLRRSLAVIHRADIAYVRSA